MNRHGQEAQVNRQLIIPRIPPPRNLYTLLRLQLLARAKLIERALALNEQRAVFAEMRELQDHISHPETRGPEGERAVVGDAGWEGGWYEVVGAQEGEVLEWEEEEHGPALCAFDRVQAAGWWWCAFEGDHPLDYG
jgi:hypothetical protein